MINFTETGFTVEVEVGCNPIEAWLETHSELIDCLQSEDPNKAAYRYHYLELLRNMMPTWEQAQRLMLSDNDMKHINMTRKLMAGAERVK